MTERFQKSYSALLRSFQVCTDLQTKLNVEVNATSHLTVCLHRCGFGMIWIYKVLPVVQLHNRACDFIRSIIIDISDNLHLRLKYRMMLSLNKGKALASIDFVMEFNLKHFAICVHLRLFIVHKRWFSQLCGMILAQNQSYFYRK